MDAKALESEATSAISGSSTLAELEDARVRYLGRKSDLAQALRDVRDRETGMLLNPIRERLEAEVEARRQALERAELDRRLREERVDVTLPGDERPIGSLHPTTHIRRLVEDAFLGLGYEIVDDREVETAHYNFDQLAFPPAHPTRSPRDTFFIDPERLLRTETSPVADPHHGGEGAAHLHGLDRPRLPARRDQRRRTSRSSTSSRASPSIAGSP